MHADPHYLCVHCHFYQPERGNPLTDEPLREPDAAPYQNWNERITAECYEPNARVGNVERISFNVGETLAGWLAEHAPQTYAKYIAADKNHLNRFGMGNAIAQTMHHTILPLERRVDKVTQVKWGKMVFAHRYGRQPEGMWLPEMGVDYESLEVLAEQGIKWTILTQSQIVEPTHGSGPYRVELPNGKHIIVFIRNEKLSNDMAFNLGHFGGAGRWAREVLTPMRREAGPLTLVATDGETFGHHWRGEELFLHWLLIYEAKSAGFTPVTLARYYHEVEPFGTVTIRENTAWSSAYGLGRWATGSGDTPGNSFWKGALRRAMDNLRWEVDHIYRDEVKRLDAGDPIQLRDAFVRVVLGYTPSEQFLKEQEVEVDGEDADRLLKLVQAQYYRQRMYTSCAFFFADLDDLSTRYGIASAAQSIMLTRDATGIDLSRDFRTDLRVAAAVDREGRHITGETIYDELVKEAGDTPTPIPSKAADGDK